MTKHLGQEPIQLYTGILGFEYRGGRSTTTAKLHTMHAMRTQGEMQGAKGWQCINDLHWCQSSKGARAFRSPSASGVSWSEVTRRPGGWILEDIYPIRDRISESDACQVFGGSRDIQTDVYLSKALSTTNHSEDAHTNDGLAELGRTRAIPSSERRSLIDHHRIKIVAEANASLKDFVAPPGERHISVSFGSHILVIDVDDNSGPVHGRMRVSPCKFLDNFGVLRHANTIARFGHRQISLCARRRVIHSERKSAYLDLSQNSLVLRRSPPSRVHFSRYLEGESRTACIYGAREPAREPERDRHTTAQPRCRLLSESCSAPVDALLRCVC